MKIIHHVQTIWHDGHGESRLVCGEPNNRQKRAAYTLGDAIKKLDYSPSSVLCAPCFYQAVGQIKFDQEPSYSEELANLLNQGQEIIDVEEL